jgi:16S rRNA (uracil1498-N3)-methyltransferase
MSLPYFFENTLVASNHILLSEETSKHCIQVLRMKEGQQLRLTDGRGNVLTAHLTTEDKKTSVVFVEQREFFLPPEKRISIGLSLLKNNNRYEWFLEKAAEIGVSSITPLICKRTEKQHFRFERMKHILVSAMLQSQQAWMPVLHEPTLFEEVVISSIHVQKLIAHCENSDKKPIQNISTVNDIQILIGPEGDFTPQEIELAKAHNFNDVSLGDTRLRSETAGVVSVALLRNRQ